MFPSQRDELGGGEGTKAAWNHLEGVGLGLKIRMGGFCGSSVNGNYAPVGITAKINFHAEVERGWRVFKGTIKR